MAAKWESSEVLAWTEREGPPRPPTGPTRLLTGALTVVLGAVFVGILSTDTLCPEHRAWVQALGTVAITGVGVALFGLLRGWASAVWITLVSALAGVAIGVLDAAHDPSRGRLIAVAFSVASVLAVVAAARTLALHRYDRALGDVVASPPVDLAAPASPPAPGVEEGEREAAPSRP